MYILTEATDFTEAVASVASYVATVLNIYIYMYIYNIYIHYTGLFCDGTRRYGILAPFFKRRQKFFNVYNQRISYLRTGTFFKRE